MSVRTFLTLAFAVTLLVSSGCGPERAPEGESGDPAKVTAPPNDPPPPPPG